MPACSWAIISQSYKSRVTDGCRQTHSKVYCRVRDLKFEIGLLPRCCTCSAESIGTSNTFFGQVWTCTAQFKACELVRAVHRMCTRPSSSVPTWHSPALYLQDFSTRCMIPLCCLAALQSSELWGVVVAKP